MMSPITRYLVLSLLCIAPISLRAQRQNNAWYFGRGAALSFNGGSPTDIPGSKLSSLEGCASIADRATGALLFYTDGITVWDRDGTPMQSYLPLQGNQSSSQSALIAPVPYDNNRYYIFTTDAKEHALSNGLQYAIVDMRLNGGMGDLEAPSKPLIQPATEKVTAVYRCNGNEFWVLAHGWTDNKFYAFPVTAAGVGTPVISSVGLTHIGPPDDNSVGYMKASPNGSKVAVAIRDLETVQLFDFDAATGAFSNPITLKSPIPDCQTYGLSFSPDNSKLYVGEYYGGVFQYDLASGDSASIVASRFTLWDYNTDRQNLGALQLAPDGKIYGAVFNQGYLMVINNPNAAGAACGLVHHGLMLHQGQSAIGLPNMIDSWGGDRNGGRDSVRAYISRSLNGSPGKSTIVPVMVYRPNDMASVTHLSVRVGYREDVVSVRRVIAAGAWSIVETGDSAGEVHATLRRPIGGQANASDTLMLVEFVGRASEVGSTDLPVTLEFGSENCLIPIGYPGLITIRTSGISDRDGSGSVGYSVLAESPGRFAYSLARAGEARLQIFDARGGLVTTLLDGELPAGRYSATWDASGVPSGTYFCRLTSGGWTGVARVVIAR